MLVKFFEYHTNNSFLFDVYFLSQSIDLSSQNVSTVSCAALAAVQDVLGTVCVSQYRSIRLEANYLRETSNSKSSNCFVGADCFLKKYIFRVFNFHSDENKFLMYSFPTVKFFNGLIRFSYMQCITCVNNFIHMCSGYTLQISVSTLVEDCVFASDTTHFEVMQNCFCKVCFPIVTSTREASQLFLKAQYKFSTQLIIFWGTNLYLTCENGRRLEVGLLYIMRPGLEIFNSGYCKENLNRMDSKFRSSV